MASIVVQPEGSSLSATKRRRRKGFREPRGGFDRTRSDADYFGSWGDGDGAGALRRGSFSQITPDGFRWRGEVARDEGRTGVLHLEYFARRMAA